MERKDGGSYKDFLTNDVLVLPPFPTKCRLLMAFSSKTSAIHLTVPWVDSVWKEVGKHINTLIYWPITGCA